MPSVRSKEIRFKSLPQGMPHAGNFELAEIDVPEPKAGEFLVRNIWMSVDPYMRGRMMERESYIPPFRIGKALQGGAIGQVIASQNDHFKVGDYVESMLGWREYFLSDGTAIAKVDPSRGPIEAYLGVLGMPGLTAYVGLTKIAQLKDGENVFVSAASGAVGAVVCQMAKARGCYVVGSAGSDEKCAWLEKEAGIDKAINYKTCGDLDKAIGDAFPNGIDVAFENVGGAHLEAAINHMNFFGRIVLCGMIADYNSPAPAPGPRNLMLVVGKSLKLEGFIVMNHYHLFPEFHAEMGKLIAAGKIKWKETIEDGIEKAPQAFLKLFSGANFGKMLVRLGPDPAV